MTFKDFDKLTEQLFKEVRTMRDTKGKEYARTADRFDNFNRIAGDLDLDRLVVWSVYFKKHIDAVFSFVKHKRVFSTENIRGRVVDAITYLTLFEGMVEELEQNSNASKRIPRNISSSGRPQTGLALADSRGPQGVANAGRTRRVLPSVSSRRLCKSRRRSG